MSAASRIGGCIQPEEIPVGPERHRIDGDAPLSIRNGQEIDPVRLQIGITQEDRIEIEEEIAAVSADRDEDTVIIPFADLLVRHGGHLNPAAGHRGVVQDRDQLGILLAESGVDARLDLQRVRENAGARGSHSSSGTTTLSSI